MLVIKVSSSLRGASISLSQCFFTRTKGSGTQLRFRNSLSHPHCISI